MKWGQQVSIHKVIKDSPKQIYSGITNIIAAPVKISVEMIDSKLPTVFNHVTLRW